MNIKEALQQLDVDNDEQWTADGLPKVDVVSELVDETVTRKDIIDAAPQFTRENPEVETEDSQETSTNSSEESSNETETDVSTDTEDLNLNPIELEYVTVSDPVAFSQVHLQGRTKEEIETLLNTIDADEVTSQRKIADEKNRLEKINDVRSVVRTYYDTLFPGPTFEENQKSVINSEANRRRDNALKTQSIVGKLTEKDVQELSGMSPVDFALRRKTGFGVNRPSVPKS